MNSRWSLKKTSLVFIHIESEFDIVAVPAWCVYCDCWIDFVKYKCWPRNIFGTYNCWPKPNLVQYEIAWFLSVYSNSILEEELKNLKSEEDLNFDVSLYTFSFILRKRLYIVSVTVTIHKEYLIVTVTIFKEYLIVTVTIFRKYLIVTLFSWVDPA